MTATDVDPQTAAGDAVTTDDQGAAADASGFGGLGLDDRLLAALAGLGYEEPTEIQRAAIPSLLEGKDVLAEAPTGTGKTAAFALPMVQRLGAVRPRDRDGRPRAFVLTPTRELAIQVAEAIHRYGQPFAIRVLPVYGGQAIGQQLRGLARGVDVLVATPGRAVDHLTRASIALDRIEVVVLDEADEMLDMGFAEDLEAILSATPKTRQTALFSATISPADREDRPSAISTTRSASGSIARGRPASRRPRFARSRTSSAAPTSPSPSAGSSTSRTRPRRSCSPGPAARSTSWPSACRPRATTRRRSTAAWSRSSAIG